MVIILVKFYITQTKIFNIKIDKEKPKKSIVDYYFEKKRIVKKTNKLNKPVCERHVC